MPNFGAVLSRAIPLVADDINQRGQLDQQRRTALLAQLHTMNQDRNADNASTRADALGLANITHLNAESTKLQQPIPPTKNIMRGPGGQLVDLSDPSAPKNIGPAPLPKVQAPVMGSPEWIAAQKAKAQIGAQYRPPQQQTFTPFQGTDPTTGKPVVRPFNTKTGQFGEPADVAPKGTSSGGLAAPMATKVGQFGELLKKTPDLFKAMEGLDVGYTNSAAQDIAEHGVGIGSLRIPGTKGIGNSMLNNSPQFAAYQSALAPWVLSAAHATSGAKINKDQSDMIKSSVERRMDDVTTVKAQKDKNLIDQLNSIAGSLPADAVAAQEAQMDPAVLQGLRDRGYRSPTQKNAPANVPSSAPKTPAPTGNIDLRTPPPSTAQSSRAQQLWDAAVAKHGEATVLKEFGPRPNEEE